MRPEKPHDYQEIRVSWQKWQHVDNRPKFTSLHLKAPDIPNFRYRIAGVPEH